MSFKSRKVKVMIENSIGVPVGTYDSVECPAEYKDRYSEEAWVIHPTRNEPVRMITVGRGAEATYVA